MCIGAFVYPQTMGSVFQLGGMGPLDYIQTAFIEVAREDLAQRFVKETKEKYLLFVDSDHVFTYKDAHKLVDAMEHYPNLGVCGGLTVFRDGRFKPVVQWFENDHAIPGKKLFERTKRYMREKCVKQVDYLGTGFTLIRREVFTGDKKHPPLETPYFRVYHDNKKNFWGEDVHFITAVRAAGWKTAVHFGTNIGHIGSVTYFPEDLTQIETDDWLAVNRPKEVVPGRETIEILGEPQENLDKEVSHSL